MARGGRRPLRRARSATCCASPCRPGTPRPRRRCRSRRPSSRPAARPAGPAGLEPVCRRAGLPRRASPRVAPPPRRGWPLPSARPGRGLAAAARRGGRGDRRRRPRRRARRARPPRRRAGRGRPRRRCSARAGTSGSPPTRVRRRATRRGSRCCAATSGRRRAPGRPPSRRCATSGWSPGGTTATTCSTSRARPTRTSARCCSPRAGSRARRCSSGGFTRTVGGRSSCVDAAGAAPGRAPRGALRRAVARGAGRRGGRTTPTATRPRPRAHLPSVAWRTAKEALEPGPVLVQVPRRGYLPVAVLPDLPAPGPVRALRRAARRCAGPRRPPACRWCGAASRRVRAARRAAAAGCARPSSAPGARPRSSAGRSPACRSHTSGRRCRARRGGRRRRGWSSSTPGRRAGGRGGYAAALLLDAWALLDRPTPRRGRGGAAPLAGGGGAGAAGVRGRPGRPVRAPRPTRVARRRGAGALGPGVVRRARARRAARARRCRRPSRLAALTGARAAPSRRPSPSRPAGTASVLGPLPHGRTRPLGARCSPSRGPTRPGAWRPRARGDARPGVGPQGPRPACRCGSTRRTRTACRPPPHTAAPSLRASRRRPRIRLFGDPVLRTPAERSSTSTGAAPARQGPHRHDARAPGAGSPRRRSAWACGCSPTTSTTSSATWSTPTSTSPTRSRTGARAACPSPACTSTRRAPLQRRGQGLQPYGEPVTVEGTELLARCVQHETDHLDGILFIDRLDREQRKQAMRPIREAEWAGAAAPVVKVSPHADASAAAL